MNESSLILYFGPMSIFLLTLFCAMFNTGLLFIAHKHRAIEWYEIHRKPWMPEKCEFCLFFWMASLELCTWYSLAHKCPFEWGAFFMMFAFALCAAVVSSFLFNFRHAAQ